MKSNLRRTFRPTLEAMEDRLVPSYSWGTVYGGDARAAVLTAAQPAPALSSFQWGVGRGIDNAAVLTGRKAGGDSTAVSLTVPPGPTTVVTAAPSILLKRVGGDALPTESFSLTFTKVE
jgi:hypothetical protein